MKNQIRFTSTWLLLAGALVSCADFSPTGPVADAPSVFLGTGGAPVGDYVDSFEGTALDGNRWVVLGTPGRATVDNRLEVGVAPSTAEAVKLVYGLDQNFSGSSFHAEISRYASGASTLGTFLAVTDSSELSFVIFNAFGGQLTAWYRWSGQAPVQLSGSLTLDPVAHRFLRLRESAGSVHYETSPDGQSWTTRWTVTHAFPNVGALRGMLGVQAWGATSSNPVGAIFEGVNTLAPAAPRDLTATFGGAFTLDVSWQDHSVNETGFAVERRVAGESVFATIATLGANATSYQDSGLTADVTYEYRVRALGASGTSDASHVAEATALGEPPPLPPSLSTLSDSFDGSSIDLDLWEVIGHESSISFDNRLELVTRPGVNEHVFARNRLPYSFEGATFNVEVSQYSTGTSTTETFLGVYSTDEEEYVAVSIHNNTITAWYKWRHQQNFTQLPGTLTLNPAQHRFYQVREQNGMVYIETSATGQNWVMHWTTDHEFTDLHDLHGYLGVGTWGTPNYNPTVSYFEGVNSLVPASPRQLAATGSPESVQLVWEDRSVNESGFQIERRIAGTPNFSLVTTTAANVASYLDEGLSDGVTYEYRVRAFGATGTSAFTGVASATAEEDNTPPPPPPPPALSVLADGFTGTTLDTNLWNFRGQPGRVTVDNRLELALAANTVENNSLMSAQIHDFAGSTFQVEVSRYASGSSTVGTYVAVTSADESSYVIFNAFNGQLSAWRRWNGGTAVQLGSVALNATNHRFLRLRESGGTVYFETSPTGASWTVRWSVAHAFSSLHLHGLVGVQAWGTSHSNPISAIIENVNSLVPASPRQLTAIGGPESVQITWEDRSVNETGFQVERRVAGAPSFSLVATTSANVASYLDEGLSDGVTYEYRVRAAGAAGTSAFTGMASATAEEDNTPPPPPPPPPPATFSALVDDFSGTTLDTNLWDARVQPGRMTINNRLELALAANTVENNSLMSDSTYDFAGSAFQVEISRYASGSATLGTYIAVTNATETSYVIFNVFNGQLTAWRRWNGGAPAQLGSVTLNATNHRFLRLRESGGTVYFETSSNGQSWTVRWTVAHAFSSLQLHGIVGVQAWGTSHSNPISAIIENVGVTSP